MKYLSDAQLAQIQAGVPMATVLEASTLTTAQKAELMADIGEGARLAAEAAATKLALETAAATEAAKLKTDAEAAAAALAAKAGQAEAGTVTYLEKQLALVNGQLLEAKVAAAAHEANVKFVEPLLKIARSAIGKMHIALGASSAVADTLDAAAAIAEHDRVAATFNEKFKPGQQSGAAKVPESKAVDNSAFAAVVKFAPGATKSKE